MIDNKTKPEYVNFANVSYAQWEVEINIGIMYPPLAPNTGTGKADAHGQFVARLVMSPGHSPPPHPAPGPRARREQFPKRALCEATA